MPPALATHGPAAGRPSGDYREAQRDRDTAIICSYTVQVKLATSQGSTPVGVRELKNRLSAYLDLVKSGQEIVVTEHGRPIARLSPLTADVDRMAALVKAGIVQPPRSAQRRLPTERVTPVGSNSLDEHVAEQRR